MITSPTRVAYYSATLIDPILVTDPSKVIHADTLDIDPDISDHKATLLLLNFITIQSGCAKRRVWYFIFQLREYPCNITHDILFLIYNGYF